MRKAAVMDTTADNSLGNVIAANSISVFLGSCGIIRVFASRVCKIVFSMMEEERKKLRDQELEPCFLFYFTDFSDQNN